MTKTITVGDPPANQAPAVQVTADPKTGTAPLTVHFSSQAHDPEGSETLLKWEFGDGGLAGGPDAFHTYTTPGTFTAKLTVDRSGRAEHVRDGADRRHRRAGGGHGGGGDQSKTQSGAPAQSAWFGVGKPAKTSVATFSKRGLSVQVTCTEAMTRQRQADALGQAPQAARPEDGHARRKHGQVRRRRLQDGQAQAVQGRPACAQEGQGLGQGHAWREPAGTGKSAKKATRAVTLASK